MSPGVPATGAPLLNLWRGGGCRGGRSPALRHQEEQRATWPGSDYWLMKMRQRVVSPSTVQKRERFLVLGPACCQYHFRPNLQVCLHILEVYLLITLPLYL